MHGGYIYDKNIKFDFSVNMNPCSCPELLEILPEYAGRGLQYYPDPFQADFRKSISRLEGIPENMIWGGSGASELIMAITRAEQPRRAMVTVPSFSGYVHALRSLRDCEILEYALRKEDGFGLDERFLYHLEGMSRDELPDLLFLASPNNPTGQCIDSDLTDMILECCHAKGIKTVVDECFVRLSDKQTGCVKQTELYDNLYVIDAFTKLFGIPGARTGYVCSQERNIEKIRAQLPEWNMSVPAQKLGCICAEIAAGTDFVSASAEYLRVEREYLRKGLEDLGLTTYPSDTNFILFCMENTDTDLYGRLLERGILIRNCNDFPGLKDGYYRTAVKDREANRFLLEKLKEIDLLGR